MAAELGSMHPSVITPEAGDAAQPLLCTGLIESVFAIDETSLGLAWRTSWGTWRVRVSANVLPARPKPGQVWSFLGESVMHPEGGEQWEVLRGARAVPPADLIVPFLCHHIPGLVEHRANRWRIQWGGALGTALSDENIPALAASLGGGPMAWSWAEHAVDLWGRQALHMALIGRMQYVDHCDSLASWLQDHYGDQAEKRLIDDPYQLLASAPFAVVDQIARGMGLAADDHRRLRAAVEASFHIAYDNGQDGLFESDLLALLGTLSSDLDPVLCLQVADEAASLMHAEERVWIGVAVCLQMAFVAHTLAELATKGTEHSSQACVPNGCVVGRLHALSLSQLSATPACAEACIASFVAHLESDANSILIAADDPSSVARMGAQIGGATVVSTERASELEPGYRTLILTTRNIRPGMVAKMLAKQYALERLVVFHDRTIGTDRSWLAGLLEQLGVPQMSLGDAVAEVPGESRASPLNPAAYNSRQPSHTGLLVLRIDSADFHRALLGLCYQQAANAPVVVIASSEVECSAYERDWAEVCAQLPETVRSNASFTARPNTLGSGDVASAIIAWPSERPRAGSWWLAARQVASDRTIIVVPIGVDLLVQEADPVCHALIDLGAHWARNARHSAYTS